MLPTKFGVNWPFGSGEEAKNRFSRRRPWWPSWISDRNDFSYFWSTSHPDASYQVLSQLAQGCRRSRLLKQLLTPHDGRRTMDDGHWLTTIAHHEHFKTQNILGARLRILGKIFSRWHYSFIDYSGIGYEVISTREYQDWPKWDPINTISMQTLASLLTSLSRLDIYWLHLNDVTFLVQASQYHKILTGLEAHLSQ